MYVVVVVVVGGVVGVVVGFVAVVAAAVVAGVFLAKGLTLISFGLCYRLTMLKIRS